MVTEGVVAEIEIVPLPAPTLTIPIPETASTLLYVPDELAPVVLPDAEREFVTNDKIASVIAPIVIVLFDAPTLMIP